MNKLPQRSGVASTWRPWPIKTVGSDPPLMDKTVCHRSTRDIYVLSFSFFPLLSSSCHYRVSLFCLLIVVWDTIHECLCLRHTVFTQPSPNTPPQTHISHFGMMTLPVLAALNMILKRCSSHNVTLSTFSLFLSYSTLPIPPPPFHILVFISLHLPTPPPPPSLQSVTLPSSHSVHYFIPHTFYFLPRSMWGSHSARQCWVR